MPDQPGLLSGRYELVRELGRGAMGVVHLALDHALDGRNVAVKILPKELEADPRALVRLKREAMTAMKITHPNVMRLINYEESADVRFLVMEYIDGPDLLHVLAEAPEDKLDVETFLHHAAGICAGVAFAHEQGVVHADLKPSNIMLTSAGEVKITDFGVAQVVRETMTRVSRVETAGTLIYMSPELLGGERNTPLSDQYALGITFYEMLTGEPPFVRGDITDQHRNRPVPPIPDVPEHANATILKALAKRPEDRWPDVETFGRALRGEVDAPPVDWREAGTNSWAEGRTETFPAGEPPAEATGVAAVHEPPGNMISPQRHKDTKTKEGAEKDKEAKRPYAMKAVGLAVLIAVGAGAFWWMNRAPEPPPTPTTFGKLYVTSRPPDARVFVDGAEVGRAGAILDSIPAGRRAVRLTHPERSDLDTAVTVQENTIARLDNLTLSRVTATVNIITSPPDAEAWLDGRAIGRTPQTVPDVVAGVRTLRLVKPEHVELERPVRVVAPLTDLSITLEPGAVLFRGHWVRTAYRDSVVAIEREEASAAGRRQRVAGLTRQIESAISASDLDRATELTAQLHGLDAATAAPFPQRIRDANVTYLAQQAQAAWRAGDAAQRDEAFQQLRALDPNNRAIARYSGTVLGGLIRTLSGHTNWVAAVAVAGDRIVSGSIDNTIKVWDLSSGHLIRTLSGHTGYVHSVAVAGDRIVSGSADNTIKVWDINSGQLIRTLSGHTNHVRSVAVVGDRIVSGSNDRTIKVWDINSGQLIRTLSGHTSWVRSVAVAGDRIVSGSDDRTIKVWDINSGQLIRTLSGHTNTVLSVAVAGNRIVSGSDDRTIKVWNLHTGQLIRTLTGHASWVVSVAVAGDRIVSGSGDDTAKAWNLNSGQIIRTISGHTSDVMSVAVAGDRIVSGSADNTIRIWRAPWE